MLKTFIKGFVVFLCAVLCQTISAESVKLKTLRVSVTYFTPPFIISSGYEHFMGYDVNMIAFICNYLKRDCQYQAMQFANLIPSVVSKQADIAVSGIIITPNRLLRVAMSHPYLVSSSRFVTYKEKKVAAITSRTLKNTTIGVEKGSVFGEQLKTWKLSGVKIVEFSQEAEEIQALIQHKIDFALMDNYSAIYWNKHSENKLKLIGESIRYGYGYGIVIDGDNLELINEINAAVNAYVRSEQFKVNYNLYLLEF